MIENVEKEPHPVCAKTQNQAGTLSGLRAITFCDRAFGKDTLYTTKNRLRDGDTLDNQLMMAHLWIHEWGHLVHECKVPELEEETLPLLTVFSRAG